MIQCGSQSPACLHIVHFLGQLGPGKTPKPNNPNAFCIYWNKDNILNKVLVCLRFEFYFLLKHFICLSYCKFLLQFKNSVEVAHLQHSVLLETKAILEQTSDVGHVHTQERTAGSGLIANCIDKKSNYVCYILLWRWGQRGSQSPLLRCMQCLEPPVCLYINTAEHSQLNSLSLALFLKSLTSTIPPWAPSATTDKSGHPPHILKCCHRYHYQNWPTCIFP